MFKFNSNDSHFESTKVQYLENLEPTFMQFPLKEAFETYLVSVVSRFIFSFCLVRFVSIDAARGNLVHDAEIVLQPRTSSRTFV